MSQKKKLFLMVIFILAFTFNSFASKLVEIKVVDQDYLMLYFQDGEVKFVDDGSGSDAFHGHHSEPENSYVETYGDAFDKSKAAIADNWTIISDEDTNYGADGLSPVNIYRKTRVNGMSYTGWDQRLQDHGFDYTYEHFIYLELPHSMQENQTYTIEINDSINSDSNSVSITFDIFQCQSEAIHTNLVGYMSSSRIKSADLYHFLGDGGNRDYSTFEGNQVYIYDVQTGQSQAVGTVSFWMAGKIETNHNLTGSDVWNVDFTGFTQPGTYRLAVEGIGCSQDFEIKDDIYHDPYKLLVLGYFYMRIGEDSVGITPVPRRPLYIQDEDPTNCKIYVTDMDPYHPQWGTFASGDRWDQPDKWASFKKSGSPTNPNAIGGHSDALDWDRHLGHVLNIYDLCFAYILSDGALDDDDLRIAESGNGIPDIIDEARNEVDFWLSLRYNEGYSHGITNPDGNNKLYQADNTPVAAWANALNSSMLAYCFQIAGLDDLKNEYLDSALVAYNYVTNLSNQMLDTQLQGIRCRDLKMMTAAYLFNLTGETQYEDVMQSECMITGSNSSIIQQGSYNQLWGVAAYLLSKRAINYPELYENMKSSVIQKAKSKEANQVNSRPSRRGNSSEQSYWQASQDMHRTVLAHSISDNPTDQINFLDALLLEADWGLGRNPLNMIQMTTASTELADKRSVENCYTSGRNDGTPGLHPGHTPYLNIDGWGGNMVGSNPGKVLTNYYPNIDQWPHASKFINTRFIWAHSEFTPRQTMRGKAVLYAYLYYLSQKGTSITPELIADAGTDKRVIDQDENGKETILLDASNSYCSVGEITLYQWLMDTTEIATGKTAQVELDTGSYEIILKIENSNGASAVDTLAVEVLAYTSDEEADYDFETSEQIDEWLTDNFGEGGTPTASISTDQARSGSKSAKLSGNYTASSANVFKRSGALQEDAATIVYYVWLPQEMIDSAHAVAAVDSSKIGGIQNYLMHTGWDWRDIWVSLIDLQGDTWNKISLEIPEDVVNSEIKETGLVFNLLNVDIGENSVYIDDVIYQPEVIPADYDFEVPAQFDDWVVENWGDGSNPSASHSTEIAHAGSYSYKIRGDFVAGSENALRRNSSLAADVSSITYHVWVPQELVDSANAIALRNDDSTQSGGIQNYLMHTGWAWESEWFDFKDLSGNDWNEVTFVIPENVSPTSILAFGVSFQTNLVDIGSNSVYIDDIYFGKDSSTPISETDGRIPTTFVLYNNYPNPFNPETKIKYQLPNDSNVKIEIYDIMGKKVQTLVNERQNAGTHLIVFDGKGFASGLYFYSIQAGKFRDVKKMVLLK